MYHLVASPLAHVVAPTLAIGWTGYIRNPRIDEKSTINSTHLNIASLAPQRKPSQRVHLYQ
jgi:hypothetical protein